MDPIQNFSDECIARIKSQGENENLLSVSKAFAEATIRSGYSYNFTWMGRPIIQYPQDMIAMQEVIWQVKPDLIIETGVAHGGSIIYYASLLELIGGNGLVVGVDIDIRKHNREMIEAHPMMKRIKLIEGSSINDSVINQVQEIASTKKNILVCLDSNHTYDHVLKELELYAPFVTLNSYLIVFDTIVEDLPNDLYNDRPWTVGNNPKIAVHKFLGNNDHFIIDKMINDKLLVSVAPDGYLKKIH